MDLAARAILGKAPAVEAQLRGLASRRLVFFAGLPGTGKSLLVHQLAHLAAGAGRAVHLLQWDVARPVFEASPAGQRYPLNDGVTHPVIRKAAGLWVREALAAWDARHAGPDHVLIGETPFVGGRFIEVARPAEDRAEALLTSASCRFVIAVPSRDVRRFVEAERARRAADPRHPREREDAPPRVLRDVWRELARVTGRLGDDEYAPVVYRRVYETILRPRHVEIVSLDVILPIGGLSVYDFALDLPNLVPTADEADAFIASVERRYPDRAALDREIDGWWQG
ncbi:MAG TPA: hypothetical protein VK548_26015 [Candidatus Acidoferrum sp.]|nr:hypothetical protein [Candidatus Acidoferrum sp.]